MVLHARHFAAATQVAALPVRRHADGFVEVMLVTSRRSRRWIIPKGWPDAGTSEPEMAEREAREEAGLIGVADPLPMGSFVYDKRVQGIVLPCRVNVHLLRVTGQLDDWEEKGERECEWLTSRAAARRVCNLALQRLILKAGRHPAQIGPLQR